MLIQKIVVSVDFNGIVVFSYPALLRFFSGQIDSGQNILKTFTETDLGDDVVDAGIVIPIINLDDGDYTVRFFSSEPTYQKNETVAFSDAGYVLDVTDDIYIADMAVFWDWEDFLGWNRVPLERGFYAVKLNGIRYTDDTGTLEEVGFDFILTKELTLPTRTAVMRENYRILYEESVE